MALKITKKDREWFAERCGEEAIKHFPENISYVYDEAIQRHHLSDTRENRKEIRDAYKTANPRSAQYAKKTYDAFYNIGAKKNLEVSEEFTALLGYLAIDRQRSLKAMRDAIVTQFKEGDISSLDAKLIEIFKFGENDGRQHTRNESRPDRSDEESDVDKLDNAFEAARRETAKYKG